MQHTNCLVCVYTVTLHGSVRLESRDLAYVAFTLTNEIVLVAELIKAF